MPFLSSSCPFALLPFAATSKVVYTHCLQILISPLSVKFTSVSSHSGPPTKPALAKPSYALCVAESVTPSVHSVSMVAVLDGDDLSFLLDQALHVVSTLASFLAAYWTLLVVCCPLLLPSFLL